GGDDARDDRPPPATGSRGAGTRATTRGGAGEGGRCVGRGARLVGRAASAARSAGDPRGERVSERRSPTDRRGGGARRTRAGPPCLGGAGGRASRRDGRAASTTGRVAQGKGAEPRGLGGIGGSSRGDTDRRR